MVRSLNSERAVTSRTWLLLSGALACLACPTTHAQQTPAPVFSIGQPSRWQMYADALVSSAGGGLAILGTEQSVFNPVAGILSGDVEGYAGMGSGVRGVVRSPALAIGAGIDWNLTRGRADVLLTYRSAILRGGLLGHGTMVRIDWLPTRNHTVDVGLHVPLWQPLAGKTRPKHIEVDVPRGSIQPAIALAPDIESAMSDVDGAMAVIAACASPWSGESVRIVRESASCLDNEQRYTTRLVAAFALVVHDDAAAVARRARAGLLDDVLLPYDTLLGQAKSPADRIDGLAAAAHMSFTRWLADSTRLSDAAQTRARAVHARWLLGVEHLHATLLHEYRDARVTWLPLSLALTPDQYDDQSEVDSLIARAVGRPFTGHNALSYLQGRDIPLEIARSILVARDYHVLWTHDVTSRRHHTHHIDNIGYEMVADAYFPALIAAVRRYDETGRLPVYMIFLDQYFYEPRGGRLWMTMLEDPLHASVSLSGDNAEREAHLRERQSELRRVVAGSARLQRDAARHGGEKWLARTIKVHVNITDPSDFSFRSGRIVPPFPFVPDNVMRDHRKIAMYDFTEADPWKGSMLIMGAGVGEQFASSTWEDRGYKVSGPATLEARDALRRVMRAHGFTDADIPLPLRVSASTPASAPEAFAGRALQVHNEVGWGAKKSSIVRAMLYDLVQPGTIAIVPDPQWASPQWAAMVAGAAARGAHVYVVAPALANAPTPDPTLMSLAHDVLARLLEIRRDLAAPLAASGGELRVGMYAAKAELDDARARRAEVRDGVARAPWLHELFPFDGKTLSVLERSEARADRSMQSGGRLAIDEIPREPMVHQKTQLIARPGAIAALLRQPGWEDAMARALDAQTQETADLANALRTASPSAGARTDSVLSAFALGLSDEDRKRVSFYFTVGTQNQDPRGMALDGEATLVTSGFQGASGVVDLYYLMARSTWITQESELDQLLPRSSLFGRLAKWIWPVM
ncbi:MAG: hypothetical protein JWM95_2388 [Gemmatimonadetes bacterium]|nr:hypothetical protein [Gemmatimonadota bacterium]